MLRSKFRKTIVGVGIVALVSVALMIGCGGRGDTDGGPGNDDAGIGSQYVSDGGAGATIEIGIREPELGVGETTAFWVFVRDPQGQPLPWVRVFCESELGIAILEPSSGGTAFEHTNAEGLMSGQLGGLVPGSYIIECRAPIGYNLVDRAQMHIVGEVPEGFQGWPGAAGGNLGGGRITEPTDESEMAVRIVAFTSNADSVAHIDIVQGMCDSEPEPYGYDEYQIQLTNNSPSQVNLTTVTFTVNDPNAPVATHGISETLDEGETFTFVGPFTEDLLGYKVYAGTTSRLLAGTYTATFRVSGETATGEAFSETGTVTFTIGNVNNC